MAENMRDMTLNLIVNSQVNKVKEFNKNLKDTKDNIDNVTQKTGWLDKSLRRLFGAYFGIKGIKSLINTYRQIDMVQRSLNALTGSAEMGAKHFEFLKKASFQTGTGLMQVAKAYRGYYYAAKTAGLADEELQHSFLGVMIGARVLGANNQQVGGAMLALEQMLNKTTVQAQEMNLQLGNAISGAKEMAAEAMGMSVPEFVDRMQKKMINSAEFVRKFGDYMYKTFINKLPEAMKSLDASVVNMQNAWILFQKEVMGGIRGGMGQAITKLSATIMKILLSPKIIQFAHAIGFALEQVVNVLNFVVNNLTTIIMLLSPVMLGGLLDKIVVLLKDAVKWIAAGNLQLSATQVMLFRILVLLAGVQEIIAFFTPMEGALETAILGKDQSWIDRVQYLLGGLTSIYFMLDAIMGFKMTKGVFSWLGGTKAVKGIKSWAGVGKNATKATEVVKDGGELSKILKPSGQNFTRAEIDLMKSGTTTGTKTIGKGLFSKVGTKLAGLGTVAWLATLGEVINAGNQNVSKMGINPMSISPYGFAQPINYTPPQLNKTETIAPTINYEPKYHIEANSMTVEQLRAMLDERDRNFWTSLTNPTTRLVPNFSLGGNN